MLDLTGKVAIVAGAGSVAPGWGNGRATATLLARQGAAVFVVDRDEAALADTIRIIGDEGGTYAAHNCDVMDSASVEEMVAACVDRFTRVDILINNVGGSEPGNAVTMAEEAWDRQMAFNLKTAFLGCKHVIPVMQAQGKGAIVNVASIAGLRNEPSGRNLVAYSASKAGLIQFSRSTAGTFAKDGIRCNTVVPGLMHTPLVEHRILRQSGTNDAAALIAKRNSRPPLGRMGTGWDVAHAVLFLASDEAGYITGTELIVDGGLTTMIP
jgi:NAD(P)-dependent dehydrogenase (short-subunit alcohol dehydrogenase family)